MYITPLEPTADEIEQWNELAADSPEGLVFHRYEFLKLVEWQTGYKLYPLVGVERGRTVGLFPVFRRSIGPANLVYSPPHGLHIPHLGPVFERGESETSDRGCRFGRFISACLDWIEATIDPVEYLVKTSFRLADPRPFQRAGFTATPRYTYTLELSPGEEDLKQSFSRSLRRYLEPGPEVECTVPDDEVAGLKYVVQQTRERYELQGKSYDIRPTFVEELHERLPGGSVRPYVGSIEGEWRSGIIALRDDETTHYWSGGGKVDSKVPLNDLLHWKLIRDSIDDGKRAYDLVGANTPRICNYKSKFNPELAEYYLVTKQAFGTRLYRKLTANGWPSKLLDASSAALPIDWNEATGRARVQSPTALLPSILTSRSSVGTDSKNRQHDSESAGGGR